MTQNSISLQNLWNSRYQNLEDRWMEMTRTCYQLGQDGYYINFDLSNNKYNQYFKEMWENGKNSHHKGINMYLTAD